MPPHAFSPAPKVESAILRLVPDETFSQNLKDHKSYEDLIRQSFSQRRKTIKNNLKKVCNIDLIIAAGIDPSQRAEEISISQYLQLHEQISSN